MVFPATARRIRSLILPAKNKEGIALPSLNKFDFSQIDFDAGLMQVLSISHSEQKAELPLRKPPINFSVLRSDGLFSKRWGVITNKKGDAYVYCRDEPDGEKVSFHPSGRQHISITSKVAEKVNADGRFGPVWTEPEFKQDAIATFSLIFPPWGFGVKLEPPKRQKDEFWIVGHREKLIVVRFFIVDTAKKMRGKVPHIVLGQLPLREGKTLHIIAWKEPQNNLMDGIRRAFPEISSTLSELNLGEDDFTLNLQGFQSSNSAFMVTVPVHYTPSDRNA